MAANRDEIATLRSRVDALEDEVRNLRDYIDHDTVALRRDFEMLVSQWMQQRPKGVDVSKLIMHPSYQRIVGMGPRVVPLILAELERQPGHWFWALHAITGANPVPDESLGNLHAMATAWLEWGKQRGYRW